MSIGDTDIDSRNASPRQRWISTGAASSRVPPVAAVVTDVGPGWSDGRRLPRRGQKVRQALLEGWVAPLPRLEGRHTGT